MEFIFDKTKSEVLEHLCNLGLEFTESTSLDSTDSHHITESETHMLIGFDSSLCWRLRELAFQNDEAT